MKQISNFRKALRLIAGLGRRVGRFEKRWGFRGTPAETLENGHLVSSSLLEMIRIRGSEGFVIYDIGANVGTWSRLALAVFPQAIIHAFEPLPQHIELLRSSTNRPNVTIHNVALGPEATTLPLNVTNFSDAASILPLTSQSLSDFGVKEGESVNVDVVVLDTFVTLNRLPLPNLIKLDIQGYELEALKGAFLCLKNADYVLCEASFKEYYQNQPLIDDIISFLKEHGYRTVGISGGSVDSVLNQQADLLFEKSSVITNGGDDVSL